MNLEHIKPIGDVMSIGTVLGTIAGLLPALAAILSIIWTAVRLYETKTVQRLLHKERQDGES